MPWLLKDYLVIRTFVVPSIVRHVILYGCDVIWDSHTMKCVCISLRCVTYKVFVVVNYNSGILYAPDQVIT